MQWFISLADTSYYILFLKTSTQLPSRPRFTHLVCLRDVTRGVRQPVGNTPFISPTWPRDTRVSTRAVAYSLTPNTHILAPQDIAYSLTPNTHILARQDI
jgi:hypothetical protein